ncbi:Alkaline phosphatase [Orchesella cincta]|uniref:Alkaline phosphatase n=1 Tax=Orchesella cincta TaxID=48709 RepID=A0A1D2N0J5_ORCCI|nr:Alkaline phosphatase [Orchesella cincta]
MHAAAYKKSLTKAEGGEPESPESWITSAQDDLANRLKGERKFGVAKNVIMFLGDGWGVPTITLARILKGQEIDKVTFGEEGQLHVDTFPYTGMSRTFCVDAQVADSACSATAYLGGVKANTGTIGVNSNVKRLDCEAQNNEDNHVSSILAWAQAAGKSTGVVTTTRITHASPSGNYAHIANRDWESDTDITSTTDGKVDPNECDDIAEQLILNDPGKNINVILGGGRAKFLPTNVNDTENQPGIRKDGKNLRDVWIESKGETGKYIETKEALDAIDASTTDYLMGLFSHTDIGYLDEQEANNDPSLEAMTAKAIEILKKNENGFFLFVEGGRIDHSHHSGQALRAIWEAVEFDKAIQKGDDLTDDDDTLIVVTADHSHAFSFPGYANRGSKITNFAGNGTDGLPYTSLSYANGPGAKNGTAEHRYNISGDPVDDVTYRQVPLVPLSSETHGGEDVMIFAKGPFSHLLTGVHLQSYIPHVMAYASCVGSGAKAEGCTSTSSAQAFSGNSFMALLVAFILPLWFR